MSEFSLVSFLSDYGVGLLLLLTSTIGSGIAGYFKGKKVSTDAVTRKNKIYQPLIDELSAFSTYELDVRSSLKTTFLNEIVINNYKYSIDEKLITQLNILRGTIHAYENINLNRVAHNFLYNIF